MAFKRQAWYFLVYFPVNYLLATISNDKSGQNCLMDSHYTDINVKKIINLEIGYLICSECK